MQFCNSSTFLWPWNSVKVTLTSVNIEKVNGSQLSSTEKGQCEVLVTEGWTASQTHTSSSQWLHTWLLMPSKTLQTKRRYKLHFFLQSKIPIHLGNGWDTPPPLISVYTRNQGRGHHSAQNSLQCQMWPQETELREKLWSCCQSWKDGELHLGKRESHLGSMTKEFWMLQPSLKWAPVLTFSLTMFSQICSTLLLTKACMSWIWSWTRTTNWTNSNEVYIWHFFKIKNNNKKTNF